MSIKPHLCGNNRIELPSSGCGDCSGLEWRIDQLEKWKEEFLEEGYDALTNKPTINGVTVEGDKTSEEYLILALTEEELDELLNMDCYVPPCADPIICTTTVCCAQVTCGEEDMEEIEPVESGETENGETESAETESSELR